MGLFHHQLGTRSDGIVDGLKAEFGVVLAGRIIEAEALDFIWEARIAERYLGQEIDDFGDGEELSRILVMSRFDSCWWVALCLVDGEADAVGLGWRKRFASLEEAQLAWHGAH